MISKYGFTSVDEICQIRNATNQAIERLVNMIGYTMVDILNEFILSNGWDDVLLEQRAGRWIIKVDVEAIDPLLREVKSGTLAEVVICYEDLETGSDAEIDAFLLDKPYSIDVVKGDNFYTHVPTSPAFQNIHKLKNVLASEFDVDVSIS